MGTEIPANTRGTLEQAWELLDQHGQRTAAENIRRRLCADTDMPPTVVVVGEAKRGKSSLINALLGVDGIAPVGTDIVTGAYVAYVPSTVDHELPLGTASIRLSDGRTEHLAIEEVADWVTVTGRRAQDSLGVASATVRLASRAAVDLVLVDTPGVGGLMSGHGELALQAARNATALLFVSDAGQDFTAPEAAFLHRAAGAVEAVVFAVTKIDKHPLAWEAVLRQNRSLIAHHAPRFGNAPVVGVSSTLAIEALSTKDTVVAEALREESQIDVLVEALTTTVTARAQALIAANAIRATLTMLAPVECQLGERVAAVKDSQKTTDLASAERAALEDLKQKQQRWGDEYQREVVRARRRLDARLVERTGQIEPRWKERIARLPDSVLGSGQALAELSSELGGELSALRVAALEDYLHSLIEIVVEMLSRDAAKSLDLQQRLQEVGGTARTETMGSFHVTSAPDQPLGEMLVRNSFMGFGAANIINALSRGILGTVVGGGGVAAAAPLVVVGAAAAIGLTFVTKRRTGLDHARRELSSHVAQSLTRTRSEALAQADAVAHELRPEVLQAMRDYVAQRQVQLTAIIKEAQQAARSAPMERAKQASVISSQLRSVVGARQELEKLLAHQAAAVEHRRPAAGVPSPPAMANRRSW